MVELNRAVAVAMAFGPERGLEVVDGLAAEPALAGYHHLPSVRGDLLARLGRDGEAAEEFRRAAALTRNIPERTVLLRRAAECDARSDGSGPVEGFGVGERAAQPGLVRAQDGIPADVPRVPSTRPRWPAAGPGRNRISVYQRAGQKGSRPMKPKSLVWVSASAGTSTRGPYWPEERIACSICSIPPRS